MSAVFYCAWCGAAKDANSECGLVNGEWAALPKGWLVRSYEAGDDVEPPSMELACSLACVDAIAMAAAREQEFSSLVNGYYGKRPKEEEPKTSLRKAHAHAGRDMVKRYGKKWRMTKPCTKGSK